MPPQTPSLAAPTIFSPTQHTHLLPSLASLHSTCIDQDHTMLFFLPPLSPAKILSYWESQAHKASEGSQTIILQLGPEGEEEGEEEVVGCVVLVVDSPAVETGPFRAAVQKLLVSPNYRRRGVAKRLMGKLEDVARGEGKMLLVLGTEIDTPAQDVYSRLGYTQYGVIPDYGFSPKDGKLNGAAFFYKDLRRSEGFQDLIGG